MEENETVLSEVHLGLPVSSSATNVISRFVFVVPESRIQTNGSDDDDQNPPRRKTLNREVFYVEHRMATTLNLVGCQVWSAAIAMAEFIIDRGDQWKNFVMLEIGGGVGLCGLTAAMFAKKLICTDYLDEIVDLMKSNFNRNDTLLQAEYECRKFDVKFDEPPECDIVFGSDLIYSGDITDSFINTVKAILERGAKSFYLSLERRLNFTTDDLEITCPAYNYFLEKCEQQQVNCEEIDLQSTPRYFPHYERSKYIKLFEITLPR